MSTDLKRTLRFTKMHGAGNDFIVLNGIDQDLSTITKEQWRQLAHRQFGIGADQILLIEKAIEGARHPLKEVIINCKT